MSTRISAGVDDCPCFTTFIAKLSIDCKILNFSLHLFVYFFGNNYSIGELTRATSKERITTNIIFTGAPPIN